MIFNDLREFLAHAEELDEIRLIEGADCEADIGPIAEIMARPNAPLLLFDKIKGYPSGYRVVTNLATSMKRFCLYAGLPDTDKPMNLVKAWHDKVKTGYKPLPPIELETGPVQDNMVTGNEVNILKFPAPKWHEMDGGRYIGTGSMVIMRDPDEGWVNAAPYRVQVHDKNTATLWIAPGHQGDIIRKKYWDRGLNCPVAVSLGQDPQLWLISTLEIPWGISEYEYAGWWRNKPIEVVIGQVSGLPIPATAEIVFEGELLPPEVETRLEGPFGEYHGYFAGGQIPQPVFRIKSIMHRNNPIIHGAPWYKISPLFCHGITVSKAADIWSRIEQEVTGIKGCWVFDEATWTNMVVLSVSQQYDGHSKRAALAAKGTLPCRSSKFIIVVDDDIDPSNISEVLWALGTRCDPDTNVEILRGVTSHRLDPILSPEKRARHEFSGSTAIIVACKPYHWIKDFPPVSGSSPESLKRVRKKWEEFLK